MADKRALSPERDDDTALVAVKRQRTDGSAVALAPNVSGAPCARLRCVQMR